NSYPLGHGSSSKEKIAINKSPKNNNQGLSRSRKAEIRKNISQLEQEIENSELRLTELSEILADNSIYQGDHRELQNLLAEYEDLEKNIPLYYQKWENYTQELENNQ
ncbi:MAG: ABC transporter C-terminal domain-containing protein, partial [Clostridiales bacterium]